MFVRKAWSSQDTPQGCAEGDVEVEAAVGMKLGADKEVGAQPACTTEDPTDLNL